MIRLSMVHTPPQKSARETNRKIHDTNHYWEVTCVDFSIRLSIRLSIKARMQSLTNSIGLGASGSSVPHNRRESGSRLQAVFDRNHLKPGLDPRDIEKFQRVSLIDRRLMGWAKTFRNTG